MTAGKSLYEEAKQFIEVCYTELKKDKAEIHERLAEIERSIQQTGTYEHVFEELEHGARMAWRNSNRCIGRLFWHMLKVFDERSVRSEEEMYDATLRHIRFATNGGKIKPAITIFKPMLNEREEARIWNHQVFRYAGYETEHGIIGDPASIRFTQVCEDLGWRGEKTHFDLLPLVLQVDGNDPKWFRIPEEDVLQVAIHHPEYDWFQDLHLKWYALPLITDMQLEIGGIHYTAAPFNGWYMGTEIGARNFADRDRYNMLPKVASLMGLNMERNATLWKDKALIELNVAVLHSFKEAGVSIVDHHTAAHQFKQFEENERAVGRKVTGNWGWLIPPVSPATTHIFHSHYNNETVKPNYFYQDIPYK